MNSMQMLAEKDNPLKSEESEFEENGLYLESPFQYHDKDGECRYQEPRARYGGFDETVVARLLCLRGRTYETGPTGNHSESRGRT